MEAGETMGTPPVLHRRKGKTIRKVVHTASQEVISLTILLSADLTTDLRPDFATYEQKVPPNNNQTTFNVVRFTTTDDSINELSDLCPLNY